MEKFAKFTLIVSVPFILLMFFVNLLTSQAFLKFEYTASWFPADPFGFSTQERLEYGSVVIEYLKTDIDRSVLDDLKNGTGELVFVEREVDHLEDVKNVMLNLDLVYLIDLAIALFCYMYLKRKRTLRWKEAIRGGAAITLVLIGSIGLFAATSFWTFFEKFHALFFEGDSWLFYQTDAIIRLFPLRLWQDAVLYLLGSVILVSIILLFALKPKAAPRV